MFIFVSPAKLPPSPIVPRSSRSKNLLSMVALLMGLFCQQAFCQTNFGGLVGTVTDGSGAIVPGAVVTVKSTGTNSVQTSVTGSAGTYTFPSLLPGTYTVSIAHAGFKGFSRSPVDVQIGGTARVDATMEVGEVTETVTVTSATPDLQTDSSSLSSVIEGKAVLQTPINGRNVNNLLALVPGVIVGGSTSGNPIGNTTNGSITNAISYGNYQIGGGADGRFPRQKLCHAPILNPSAQIDFRDWRVAQEANKRRCCQSRQQWRWLVIQKDAYKF